jgi:hypothetical protein
VALYLHFSMHLHGIVYRVRLNESLLRNGHLFIYGLFNDAFSGQTIDANKLFFCNPILFAVCTSTFSKLCKNMYTCIQWHVEECSVALLCN